MKLPKVTLFALMSVDGKISTGHYMENDFDLDIRKVPELRDGVKQYYDMEKETDKFFLITGKTMFKLGINTGDLERGEVSATCVILDNKHLSYNGVVNLCEIHDRVILFTSNRNHQAFTVNYENLYVHMMERPSMRFVLETLASIYDCEALTLQSGGTVTSKFMKAKLINELNIVVAPMLVGGALTPTLVDGEISRTVATDMNRLGILELKSVKILKDSYLNLKYNVINAQSREIKQQ